MVIKAKNYALPIHSIINLCPDLIKFVDKENKIDLGNSEALYIYNKCLFKILDGIDIHLDYSFNNSNNLIPTAGLRRCIASIIIEEINPSKVIEIGTGASAIMALLLGKHNINVIATEINDHSFEKAQRHVEFNKLSDKITLVKSTGGILKYLHNYFPADCVLSLPPNYAEYTKEPSKIKGFQGIDSELYSFGEDYSFSLQLIEEWFEIKVIKYLFLLWKNRNSMQKALLTKKNLDISTQIFEILSGTRKRYVTIMYHNPKN